MTSFQKEEVSQDLSARLAAAGLDPDDPTVKAITVVVSGYFAEKTAEVLSKVRDVLDRVGPDELH